MSDALFDTPETTSASHKNPSSSTITSTPADTNNRVSSTDTRDIVSDGASNAGDLGEKIKGVFGSSDDKKAMPGAGAVAGGGVAGGGPERHKQANRDLNRE